MSPSRMIAALWPLLFWATLLPAEPRVPAVGGAPRFSADEPRFSDAPIRGVRGEPTARAVVSWSDMTRQGTRSAPARQRKRPGSRRIPRDLPVPKGAMVRIETSGAAAALPMVSLPASPAPAASFEALPNSPEVEPPDTNGAVGRNHLMVTLNSEVRIQDRSGTPLSTVTIFDFWRRVGGGEPFDPRILYDPNADRWITTAIGNFYRSILVGVSRSGDPTGTWNLYRIDPDPSDRVDFPVVGFNRNWIVVANSWLTVDQGIWTWRGSQYRVFDKADLYTGGTGSYSLIPAVGGGPEPAVTLDPEVSALYLLQAWNGNADGSGVLRLYTITGSIGSEVLTPVAFIATPDPWASEGPGCPQLGDPREISCFGGFQPVFRNGTIWGAHIVYLPAVAPTRSAIQWWQLAPDGEVLQRGRLDDLSGVAFYGFPSLAVNRNGDMLLGFTSFSENQFASASYGYRAAGDPPGTLREEHVFKAGEDSYVRDEVQHGANRWGDYSSSAVDPVNDSDLWTIQEYAMTRDPSNPTRGGASVASRWGTWWARVVPEPAVVGAPCVASGTVLCLNESRFQVEVSWRVPLQGMAGIGRAEPLTGDTGYFWFFSANNVELVVKVVDGRAFNGYFWVFYGALSDVEYTITVTDTTTGATKTYANPQGRLASVADTAAF